MVSEYNEAEAENVTSSTHEDETGVGGKKRRFSMLQKEEVSSPQAPSSPQPLLLSASQTPPKEMRRSSYDSYYNYDDYMLDDETIKVWYFYQNQ